MVTVVNPRKKGERLTYHLREPVTGTFTAIEPPSTEGYGDICESGNRSFFLEYRKNVLSRYMAPMYKWGENYETYSPHPRFVPCHRKQRWEEMYNKPNNPYTLKDQTKLKEIDDFYMLCQFQRQYYQDYTGYLHPLNYFQNAEYRWAPPPDFNSTYLQFPDMYVKYKQPLTLPLCMKRAWLEPFEPCRRLAGRCDMYPDFKFS